MKHRILLGLMLLLTLVLVSACGAGGNETNGTSDGSTDNGDTSGETANEEEKTYEWRFVTEELDGQVQYEYAQEFAKRLNEKSDGQITITPFEFGQLGSEVNQVEQLQNGAVEFAIMSPGFTGNMVEEGQVFSLQFLFPDDQRVTQNILNSSEALNQDLAKQYEDHNIKVLSYWTEGAMQWTATKAIETPADFENFKMRTQTSPLIQESYKAYGASPTALSWSELYTSLDRGTVEGQENPIFFIEDASFHEVQSHLIRSRHNNYVAMTTVNPEFYKGLPEDIQAMIDETVNDMQDWIFDKQDQLNKERLDVIKNDEENPTEIITLTDEQREAFREKALPIRDYYKEEVSTVDGAILEKLQTEIDEAK